MSVSRASAALLLALLLAASAASAGEVVLDGVKVLDEGPQDEARDWSACHVKADLIQTGPSGTRTLVSEQRLLIHGENLDLEDTLTLAEGTRQALIRLQVRVRASTVLPDGVMYLVTSEGALQAAVGFSPMETSRTQFRHDFLEIRAPIAQLREVYASPEMGVRVLLAVTASPVEDRPEPGLVPPPPGSGQLVRLAVEARRRVGARETQLRHVVLQAAIGHDASFGLSVRDANAPEADDEAGVDPSRPLGGSVRVVDRGTHPDSGFGRDHVVGRRPVDQEFLERNARAANQSYLEDHAVDLGEGPDTVTVRQAKKKKLSARKREQLREAAEVQAARAIARERQMTLAGTVGAPPPARGEQLRIRLTPLHVTERNLRLEIRIEGHAAIGSDAEPQPIDLAFIENIAWGQRFELGLRELLEGGEPDDDTIIVITPQR